MDFKTAYVQAMRDRAPKLFNSLRKTGALDAQAQKVSQQAHAMLSDLTSGLDKLPNGQPRDNAALSAAERQVMGALIEFPPEGQIPDVDGEMIPEPMVQSG